MFNFATIRTDRYHYDFSIIDGCTIIGIYDNLEKRVVYEALEVDMVGRLADED